MKTDVEKNILIARFIMETTIFSSHGTLTIDSQSGDVIRCESDKCNDNCIDKILRFDLTEYRSHYKVSDLPPDGIDILDIGYWNTDGTYEEPAHDWREETNQMRAGYNKPAVLASSTELRPRCKNHLHLPRQAPKPEAKPMYYFSLSEENGGHIATVTAQDTESLTAKILKAAKDHFDCNTVEITEKLFEIDHYRYGNQRTFAISVNDNQPMEIAINITETWLY